MRPHAEMESCPEILLQLPFRVDLENRFSFLFSAGSSKTKSNVGTVDRHFVKRLSDTADRTVDGKKYLLLDVREPAELQVRGGEGSF